MNLVVGVQRTMSSKCGRDNDHVALSIRHKSAEVRALQNSSDNVEADYHLWKVARS